MRRIAISRSRCPATAPCECFYRVGLNSTLYMLIVLLLTDCFSCLDCCNNFMRNPLLFIQSCLKRLVYHFRFIPSHCMSRQTDLKRAVNWYDWCYGGWDLCHWCDMMDGAVYERRHISLIKLCSGAWRQISTVKQWSLSRSLATRTHSLVAALRSQNVMTHQA